MSRPKGSRNNKPNDGLKFNAKNVAKVKETASKLDLSEPVETPQEALQLQQEQLSVEVNPTPQGNVESVSEAITEPSVEIQVETSPVEEVLSNETVVLCGGDFTGITKDILYLGSLGAAMTPKHFPRISTPPFMISFELKSDKYELYRKREGEIKWDSNLEYNQVVCTSPDPIVWVKQLLAMGAKGAILSVDKVVRPGRPHQAVLFTRNPVESTPSLNALPRKMLTYTKEELEGFKMDELQSIGKHYDIKGRIKTVLINNILKAQSGN